MFVKFFIIFHLSLTDSYSGSDLTSLAKDAALGPIRGKLTSLIFKRLPAILLAR